MAVTTVNFLGDVMLGRGVSEQIGRHPPEWHWGTTLRLLKEADGLIINLECAITPHRQRWVRTHKVFHFGAKPAAIDVLKAAGVDAVCLANNHVLDYDYQGLRDTLRLLDDNGIARAGAGLNAAESMAPAIVKIGAVTLGLIGMTDNEPPFAARDDRPGTNYAPIEASTLVLDRLAHSIEAARGLGANFIVLSVHWGPNMVTEPPGTFRRFARAAIDLGVDLLHGHSAHLFQGVEVRHGRLILYDTGDFLDDYAVDETLRNDWSFVFEVTIEAAQAIRLRLIPVKLSYAQTNLAEADEAVAICERMQLRCDAMATTVESTTDGLVITTGARSARAGNRKPDP